jgi:hypothetical protein
MELNYQRLKTLALLLNKFTLGQHQSNNRMIQLSYQMGLLIVNI